MIQYKITEKQKAWVKLMELIDGEKKVGNVTYVSTWSKDLYIPVETNDYIEICEKDKHIILVTYKLSIDILNKHIDIITKSL